MAVQAGPFEAAAVILGAVDALSIRFVVRTPGGLEALIARGNPRARVREALSQEKVDSAMERGRLMSLGEVAALVERIGASLSHGQPEDRIQ